MELLTDNIIVQSLCGSQLFNLQTNQSDTDFLIMYYSKEQIKQHFIEGKNDYFLWRSQDFEDCLQLSASPLIFPSYFSKEKYGYPEIIDFWNKNKNELALIDLRSSYIASCEQIEYHLKTNYERGYAVLVRFMGTLIQYYETKDMEKAVLDFNQFWRERYLLTKESKIKKQDIEKWYDNEFQSNEIKKFFLNQQQNQKIFCQQKEILSNLQKKIDVKRGDL